MDALMETLERAAQDERLESSLDLANRCYLAAYGNPAGSPATAPRRGAAESGAVSLPYATPDEVTL